MARIIEEPTYRDRIHIFQDRFHAGSLMAEKLRDYAYRRDVVMLAIPAGGVPVGYVVARELDISMEMIIVRKVQVPWNTEAGFGAVTWDGETVLNEHIMKHLQAVLKDNYFPLQSHYSMFQRESHLNSPYPVR